MSKQELLDHWFSAFGGDKFEGCHRSNRGVVSRETKSYIFIAFHLFSGPGYVKSKCI